MKTAPYPCPWGAHDDDGRYYAQGRCSTPYCTWWEYRCAKCHWYVTECPCGSSAGVSRISHAQWRAIRRRQRRRGMTRSHNACADKVR